MTKLPRFALRVGGAACLLAVVLSQVGYCDDIQWLLFWSPVFTVIVLVLVVEPLVVFYEAWYMQGVLELPRRTALKWSLVSNLVSFVVGGILQVFWGYLASGFNSGSMAGFIGFNMAVMSIPVFILISIGLSFALEYPVLRHFNKAQVAKAPLLKICLRMNAISVCLAYLLLGLISMIWPAMMRSTWD